MGEHLDNHLQLAAVHFIKEAGIYLMPITGLNKYLNSRITTSGIITWNLIALNRTKREEPA